MEWKRLVGIGEGNQDILLEIFLSGMETRLSRRYLYERSLSLKPSLVEWKRHFFYLLRVFWRYLDTFLSGMETLV